MKRPSPRRFGIGQRHAPRWRGVQQFRPRSTFQLVKVFRVWPAGDSPWPGGFADPRAVGSSRGPGGAQIRGSRHGHQHRLHPRDSAGAGLPRRLLHTHTEQGNAAMQRVNERVGFRSRQAGRSRQPGLVCSARSSAQLRRPSEPSLNSPSPSAPRPCNPLHARRNAIEAKLAGASEENQARTRGCFCRIGVLGDIGKFGWTNLENGLGLAFNVREDIQVTSPEQGAWPASDPRFSRSEVTAVVGHGQGVWERAAQDLLRWRVKTASGFTVSSADPVRQGDHVVVKARLFVLHRHGDEVSLSVRSLTRAAPQQPWRALNPTASSRAACGAAALPPLAALT